MGQRELRDMAKHILKAYEQDINIRLFGLEPANNQGWRVEAHDVEAGGGFTRIPWSRWKHSTYHTEVGQRHSDIALRHLIG